jgi:hypothetical protein
MKKLLRHKLLLLLAFMVFYPANAISREITARRMLVEVMAIVYCLKEEGLVSSQEAPIDVINALAEQGISKDKILVLLQDKSIFEEIEENVKKEGGCVEIGKDYERFTKGK